jgi:nitroimidazol reductase NimA-like FMN-containing flavoprotein (pyridoxamine 5'-phosphate oxidase superfamily)
LLGTRTPRRIRPKFPADWKVPEVPSRWVTWEQASGKLQKEEVYWIATTRKDGRPHSAPVSGLWFDDAFFFETEPDSVKGRNLRLNPSVVVHTQNGYNTVIVEGKATRENKPKMLARLRRGYIVKYDYAPDWSGPNAQWVFRVDPAVVLAWKNPRMHQSMVRFVF